MSCSCWCWSSGCRSMYAARYACGSCALVAEPRHRLCAQASSEELRLSAVQALGALVKGSCTDAFLAEENGPLLGHALSLLLQVADSEASAGDRGSRTLRAEAFRALELLLRQVRAPASTWAYRVVLRIPANGCTASCAGWRS